MASDISTNNVFSPDAQPAYKHPRHTTCSIFRETLFTLIIYCPVPYQPPVMPVLLLLQWCCCNWSNSLAFGHSIGSIYSLRAAAGAAAQCRSRLERQSIRMESIQQCNKYQLCCLASGSSRSTTTAGDGGIVLVAAAAEAATVVAVDEGNWVHVVNVSNDK